MAGDPLSVALPLSPSTTARSTNTAFKDVPMTEKTTKIGQKMNDFKSDVDFLIRTKTLLVLTPLPLAPCYLQKA